MTTGLLLAAQVGFSADEKAVFNFAEGYATVAHAVFDDALQSAQALEASVQQLIEKPSAVTLAAAKDAWKIARVPYQQSEVYRFGNGIVDDWEGQLNAWPLDEGLIDYVDGSYEHELGNAGATANIVSQTSLKVGAKTLDLSKITPDLLASLNELAGSEANVATGYHAIEFLLWGQDLNGTNPGAGERPYTDFAQGKDCTHENCDRRGEYLQAASALLVSDLQEMVAQWATGSKDNYRAELQALPQKEVLTRALYGMGSLSLGELAGERMKVALEAQSPEDEHDCFSDNTHFSHFYNAQGVQNVYTGEYTKLDGTVVKAVGVSHLAAAQDKVLDLEMKTKLSTTELKLQAIVDAAEADTPIKFDQMIAPGNKVGEVIVRASIDALVAQTATIEKVAHALSIDNLNPDTADHSF